MNVEQADISIEVTVDKSHIITIGERLYGEALELVRELVNNAYDADATEVYVRIDPGMIIVKDDGQGMDLAGLKKYFSIGASVKKHQNKSPKFGRDRIGEFGIGKFASLAACARFEVWTKRGEFQGRAIFDKEQWASAGNTWHIPLEIEPADHRHKDGTAVTLTGVTKQFQLADVEKRIRESVPIKAKDFAVYVNSQKINPKYVAGHKIPFLEGTDFGTVYGEIVVTASVDQDISEAGVECKVKQVTVTREFFGLERYINNIARVRGEVNADFLILTSDRSGFIKDNPEYKAFADAMGRTVEKIRPVLEDLSDMKDNRRTRGALTDVLEKVRTALVMNPDYCPEGMIPEGVASGADGGVPGHIPPERKTGEKSDHNTPLDGHLVSAKKKRVKKTVVKRLTPTAVVKRMKMGQQGISCCVDHFGADAPECFTEGTIIYINRDHPLYQKESLKKETCIRHLARLITQEVCMMKDPRNPRQAFQRQSKLLQDALLT